MFKLSIALGWSVIKMHLRDEYLNPYQGLWNKIQQHRFIMSDNIDAYYSENAEKEGMLTEYQAFISMISETDQSLEIRDVYGDYNKNLANYLKNKCKSIAIVISEENELKISKSSCRYQYSIEEASRDENGPLGMYSVISSFYVDEGEDASACIEWIKNIISEEKEISIIDPYILKELRNCNCLVNYYFPIIPRGCVLNLHVQASASLYETQAMVAAENANVQLKIHKYRKMKHERYIITSKRIIVIGVGMDFMKKEGNRPIMRTGSNFTLREIRDKKPHLQNARRLAGDPEME